MTIYFISDIHLSEEEYQLLEMFDQFINYCLLTKPQAIYIIGDLFALWLGDDNIKQSWLSKLSQQFLSLQQQQIEVYFQRGNRDILFTEKIANALNLIYLPDIYTIDIQGRSITLTHGDLLVDDHKYLQMRKIINSAYFKILFNILPFSWRNSFANYLRQKSKLNFDKKLKNLQQKYPDQAINQLIDQAKITTDPNLVIALANQEHSQIIINGHIHLQQHNRLINRSNKQTYISQYVMADWQPGQFSILILKNNKFQFINKL